MIDPGKAAYHKEDPNGEKAKYTPELISPLSV
jgi:hypothetical protein